MSIAGVILAAGRSSRMGKAKARIAIEGEPLLSRLVRIFGEASLDPIVVVAAEELADLIGEAHRIDGGAEMIDSLACGIEALPRVDAIVVQPVDAAFTTAAAIRALIERIDRPRALAFEGTPGHPVLVPKALFPAICARPAGGLRTLLEDAELVAWDRSVLADLDTPADLVRWKVHE